MYLKILRLVTVIVILVFVLAGCGQAMENPTVGTPEVSGTGTAASFHIVTSFYPVYVATINITRDVPGVTVTDMTKPQTGCLEDYSLKPDDLKTLENADAFVVNGAGMENFLDKVIKQQKNLKIVVASRGIKLIQKNGVVNPHVWVSVSNAITYVNNIASQLSELDSANADRYAANAAAYVQKLEKLKKDMHSAVDGLKNRDIITFHEAFPYFAQEFNLKIAAVIEREPGTEPSPRDLGGIIDTVEASGIKALFAEPQYSPKAAYAIAAETGAKVYSLDPVVTGAAAGPGAYDAYINAMELNKKVLVEALQ